MSKHHNGPDAFSELLIVTNDGYDEEVQDLPSAAPVIEPLPAPKRVPVFPFSKIYTYPETGVLKNSLSLQSYEALSSFEERLTKQTIEIAQNHLKKLSFSELCTFDTLKTIHDDIFSSIYPDFAGKPRQTIIKRDHVLFIPPPFIEPEAQKIFSRLAIDPDIIVPSSQEAFIKAFADYYLQLYRVHSFREGNTRSLGVLFTEISERAGYSCQLLDLDMEQKLSHRNTAYFALRTFIHRPFIEWLNNGILTLRQTPEHSLTPAVSIPHSSCCASSSSRTLPDISSRSSSPEIRHLSWVSKLPPHELKHAKELYNLDVASSLENKPSPYSLWQEKEAIRTNTTLFNNLNLR